MVAVTSSDVWASKSLSRGQIAACEKWAQRHPTHYLAWVQLGETILEQARLTHDPRSIARARESLLYSLKLQPNFRAYRTLSALSNFTHRFEDALHWSTLASEALPRDSSLLAQKVEALLGLGRLEDVGRLLADAPDRDFFSAASRGRWHVESGRIDEAVEAFELALGLAEEARMNELEVWAEVAAGAALLDSGRYEEASPYLERAAVLAPGSILVEIHLAELLEARGELAAAFRKYRHLARRTGDPEMHSRAFVLARRLKRFRLAHRHYEQAERGFVQVSEVGEIYSLDLLAKLYSTVGRNKEAREVLDTID